MRSRIRHLALLTLLAPLAACGPAAYRWEPQTADPAQDRTYEVRRGDTLYSIAWRYGLDYRELSKRNGIGSSYTIYPGQQLALVSVPNTAASAGAAQRDVAREQAPAIERMPARAMPRGAWQWPVKGDVIAAFGAPNATGKGIAIGASEGDPVLAAADGRVVYAGSGLIGYGKIIIVKHSEEYLSAYGHNDTIYVREGDEVKQGDRIAAVGRGPGNQPLLHFEIRLDGKAVDPLAYLPAR